MRHDAFDDRPAEPGYLLGALIIAALLIPQLAVLGGYVRQDSHAGEFLVGAYLIFIGILFLASFYWSHKTFVLRGFMWVCENLSAPAGRRMAFFYFALCVFFGAMAIAAGFGMIQIRR